MKTVVNALFMSLSGLANVFVVLVIVWFMFAILGVQLFAGALCVGAAGCHRPREG